MQADEIDTLKHENGATIQRLASMDQQVQGLDNHYIISLLEVLVPPEIVVELSLAHQRWIKQTLEPIEQNVIRKRLIGAVPFPVHKPNGG